MSYWDETDQYLSQHGHGPKCPRCGKEMFPADDHGRFSCLCNLGSHLDVATGTMLVAPRIPQVDVGAMSDEQKAKIPPINRLESEPTTAEANFLAILLQGPKAMASPAYAEACKALAEERGE